MALQNLTLGVVFLVKAFKSNDSTIGQCLMADSGGHFTRAGLNVHTKVEIHRAKSRLEKLLSQIDSLETRLANIQRIKKMAKEFLEQNGFSTLQLTA